MAISRSESPADTGTSGRDVVVDVAVIGAGPAGLAAAVAAVERGADVALIDSEIGVGGQFWRHPARADESNDLKEDDAVDLHHDLSTYRELLTRARTGIGSGRLWHLARHEVWSVTSDGSPGDPRSADPGRTRFVVNAAVRAGTRPSAATIRARTLLLATGAYDLQVPFPGWDLPGVITAGGAQSLLKGHRVLAGRRVVVAGTGPFLLSVASGLARSGGAVLGVYEAARPTRWLRSLPAITGAPSKVAEGLGYAKDLARHRIPYRTGWTVLAARGADQLEEVVVAPLGRSGVPRRDRSRTLAADVLAVGWGFVPQVDLAVGLGCDMASGPDGLPVVRVDAACRTSAPGVYAAGEISGVGGAGRAVLDGELAGIAAAREVTGYLDDDADRARIARLLRDRRRLVTFARALHRSYPVPSCWLDGLTDDTVVCRCEEVTAGTIRAAVAQDDVPDARTAKLLVRPGMGWCQGRICGYPTERLVQAAGPTASVPGRGDPARPTPLAAVERPVATPVPLGMLAEAAGLPDGRRR